VVHSSKLSWAYEPRGSIGTCHRVHHHGAPLKLMRTLREFQDGQEIWVTLQSSPRYSSYHQIVRDDSGEKSLRPWSVIHVLLQEDHQNKKTR
jgi:hypothetical protein